VLESPEICILSYKMNFERYTIAKFTIFLIAYCHQRRCDNVTYCIFYGGKSMPIITERTTDAYFRCFYNILI